MGSRTGEWVVSTRFSAYLINYDAETVVRHTRGLALRRDEQPVKFFEMGEPVVGQGLVMMLSPLADGVAATQRITSDVVSFEPLAS